MGSTTASAVAVMTRAPTSGSRPRRRPKRTVTASRPKRAPASAPKKTAPRYYAPLVGSARTLTEKIIDEHLVGSTRGGDRAAHRPDPPRGRDRHHGLPAVRATRRRPRGRPDSLVRRPQHAAVRQQELRGPRLPPQLGRALRGALLAAGKRHLALPSPRALRPARPRAARRGQPHDHGRGARDAGDRRGRDRGGRGDGGQAVRTRAPSDRGRRAARAAAALGAVEGHRARAAAAA